MPKVQITNLVFQGGSVKGIAYLGALEALEERIDIKQIKRVAGTSAGSLSAGLLAIGCDLARVKEELLNFSFKDILDDKPGDIPTRENVLKSVSKHQEGKSGFFSKIPAKMVKIPIGTRLVEQYGVYEGEYIRKWMEDIIQKQVSTLTGGAYSGKNLTFGELHDLALKYPGVFRDLVVVGANLSKEKKMVFSYLNPETKEVIISDAIRISMSIPYLFKPHHIYYKHDGDREIERRRDFLVDGGIYENYPIRCFDHPGYLDEGQELLQAEDGLFFNPHTLGFRLVSSTHKNELEGLSEDTIENKTGAGLLTFSLQMLQTNFHLQEEQYRRAENIKRTVLIDHRNVSTLAFNITPEQQSGLILSGKQETDKYLRKRAAEIELVRDYADEREEQVVGLVS
jgi:NTE family protein